MRYLLAILLIALFMLSAATATSARPFYQTVTGSFRCDIEIDGDEITAHDCAVFDLTIE